MVDERSFDQDSKRPIAGEAMMLGEVVRGHRRRLGLTQEGLAERAGISVRGIRNLEAGRIRVPRVGTLRVLADALELEAAERDRLFTFTFDEQRLDQRSGTPDAYPTGVDPHLSALAGDGWHTARFTVLVRLDTPGVETYQDWRIIADCDGLDQITPGLTIPVTSNDAVPALTVEARYGARLVRHEQPLPHRSQFTLALPQPLQAGQSHDCGIIIRLGAGQPMRPHYVLTATRLCGQFALRVRFHPDRLPRWVRRVCAEPVRMMDVVQPGTEPLTVNAGGEIYTRFDQPTLYLAHGAQWQPADGPAP